MIHPLLAVKNVTKSFSGIIANRNVSLEVKAGELVGLIGPNGAGKSTLFNLVAGAFTPDSGTVLLEGRDITQIAAPQRCVLGIGRTFQVPRSFDSMSVVENVIVGALVKHKNMRAARSAALGVLDFVDLATKADAPAAILTPPEKRRLEMARALATEPKLLLLDEVMTGLTPSEAALGVELIRHVHQLGIAVIMVEHVMEIVMPLVERAIVLDLGQVLAEGKPSDIVQNPKVIAAYFGERPHAA